MPAAGVSCRVEACEERDLSCRALGQPWRIEAGIKRDRGAGQVAEHTPPIAGSGVSGCDGVGRASISQAEAVHEQSEDHALTLPTLSLVLAPLP